MFWKASIWEIVSLRKRGYPLIYRKFIKRALDLLVSIIGLICISPILLVIAIMVRIKIGSPIIFKQQRPGLDEKIFTLYKFRTMSNEKDQNGKLLTDSKRLNEFGKMLRRSSLDELPELFNIIKGEMSIIGPRPLLIKYLPYYSQAEKIRHSVRPGLTGLAQISGRNLLKWDSRLAKDVEYVKNISFRIDTKIFIKTILKVVKKDGIIVTDQSFQRDLDIERSQNADKEFGI